MKRKRSIRSGFRRKSQQSDELRQYFKVPSEIPIPGNALGIPDELEDCVRSFREDPEQVHLLRYQYPSIYEEMNPENYQVRMETLVYLEEIHKKYTYERLSDELLFVYIYYDELDDLYHLDDVLHLQLHKQRPSIPIGGKIQLTDEDGDYFGIIIKVEQDGISFDLPDDDINDGTYCVNLIYSETNMKKQILAMRRVIRCHGYSFLFPELKFQRLDQSMNCVVNRWFNTALNSYQQEAVKNILRGVCRPMPYVVLGPPGTGKTITLVEAICQVATLIDHSVILVATSTNRCANNITQKLVKMGLEERFVRYTSINYYETGFIPEDIKHVTMSVLTSGPELIKKFKIIIGTCSTIGTFMFKDLPSNYFTHVFVDEAGQVTEPEIMIPISLLDPRESQIVLFGDPLQVGPPVFAMHCKSKMEDRLDCSFLQRLMEFEPYRDDENYYDDDLVTKLVYNYRSIPSVLWIFNNLFYGNELISKKTNDDTILETFQSLYKFKCHKDHGVFFFDIRGESLLDTNFSPYNAFEARAVADMANKLLDNGIKPHQIAIITPYFGQIEEITNSFLRDELPYIGTVDAVQGLEFDIVLFSSVRTDKFGFMDPKRLNVALSRAKYLLVIFGCETFLVDDFDWAALIAYCVGEKAFTY